MTNIVPEIDDTQDIYSEQIIILRKGPNVVGRIIAHYPTDRFGGPDMEGPRSPIFTGAVLLIGTDQHGRSAQIPLEFPIDEVDPITACRKFPDLAQAAIEEFQSRNFRSSLIVPGAKPS